ncbi:MAG: hypothetical protein J5612_01920 [Paludibacteraceae bacterium]|nr:hypothetical protein [Paludibacteraceae bacterium]
MTKQYTKPRTLTMPLRSVDVLLASPVAQQSSTETITIGGGGKPGSGR